MKIILMKDDRKLGKKGDIIVVKDGYGTYLIKQNAAIVANKSSINALNKRNEEDRLFDSQMRLQANDFKKLLEKETIYVNVPYNKQNQMLTKSITKEAVIKTITSTHPDINITSKDFIDFPKTRLAQVYKATLKLYKDIVANIEFGVEL